MYGSSDPNIIRPQLKRVRQISESHCGPAVLQMLLSHLGINVSQEELTRVINAESFIHDRGLRVDELARATSIVAPNTQFWYKDHSLTDDLVTLVRDFQWPTGVEWQNLFYNTVEEEYEDTEGEQYDFGHYSVVVAIHPEENLIVHADPYPEFAGQNRYFSLDWFESRWWDVNPVTLFGKTEEVLDERMMFVITQKGTFFPKALGMKPLS